MTLVIIYSDPANTNGCLPEGGYQVPVSGTYRLSFSSSIAYSQNSGNNGRVVARWLIKREGVNNGNFSILMGNNGSQYVDYYNGRHFQSVSSGLYTNNQIPNTTEYGLLNFQHRHWWGSSIVWSGGVVPVRPYGSVASATSGEWNDEWQYGDSSIAENTDLTFIGESAPIFGGPANSWYVNDNTGAGGSESQGTWNARRMECNMDLEAGDIINVAYFGTQGSSGNMWLDVVDETLIIFPEFEGFANIPSPVIMKNVLGCGTKQIDLLKGLTELFNLHWTADAQKKIISVEPYDDFYGTGKILDWSDKLDHNNWTDKFVIADLARITNYRYKSDSSDTCISEWEAFNEPNTFMGKILEENELYRKDVEDLGTTVFHSTYSFVDSTVLPGITPMWIPVMWEEDEFLQHADSDTNAYYDGTFNTIDWTGVTRPENNNYNKGLRILNYYGKQSTTNSGGISYTYESGGSTVSIPGYPYADTVNRQSQTADPFSLHYDDVIMEDGTISPGLYTKYWKRLHDKISGGSSLRTCMMNLNDSDIALLDYRDIIRLDEQGVASYWTIHKIIDYKPGKDELTKVELVQYNTPPKQEVANLQKTRWCNRTF